jgi:hypothetical protein
MPPPSPYNLNRWIVVGAVALVVTGYFSTRGRKPAFELERVGPESVTLAPEAASVDAMSADSEKDGAIQ